MFWTVFCSKIFHWIHVDSSSLSCLKHQIDDEFFTKAIAFFVDLNWMEEKTFECILDTENSRKFLNLVSVETLSGKKKFLDPILQQNFNGSVSVASWTMFHSISVMGWSNNSYHLSNSPNVSINKKQQLFFGLLNHHLNTIQNSFCKLTLNFSF